MFRASHPVVWMCSLLQVARSGYYAWKSRGGKPSRQDSDLRLTTLIRSVHTQWKGIFGYRRMVDCLRSMHGESVGARRVRRLMEEAGLFGIPRRKRRRAPIRTDSEVPDLLRRKFRSERPNAIWVTDITQISTGEGKLYLCVVKDVHDGSVVGWRTGPRQTADLVTSTVDHAVAKRLEGDRPVLHSDHGSQYTSQAYRECLERHELTMSMGRVRTCADNASAESVFGQLKRELVNRCRFETRTEAARKIDAYFTLIYNPLRRASLLREELQRIAEMDETEERLVP